MVKKLTDGLIKDKVLLKEMKERYSRKKKKKTSDEDIENQNETEDSTNEEK